MRLSETVTMMLVRGENPDGKPIYAYVAVRADKLEEFMQAQSTGLFYPEDYGVIIEAGEGEPSEEVQEKMSSEYGFRHDTMQDVPAENTQAWLIAHLESLEYQALEVESNAQTRSELIISSPSLSLILDLQRGSSDLYDVGWRQFEELVAELLHLQGWSVELQRGTKDGGVDVLASRYDPQVGHLLTVWQAKKLSRGSKVGISVVRELADTRDQFRASKGVIVTSSYLTRGALDRVTQDKYTLGKVDRDELQNWIRNYQSRKGG